MVNGRGLLRGVVARASRHYSYRSCIGVANWARLGVWVGPGHFNTRTPRCRVRREEFRLFSAGSAYIYLLAPDLGRSRCFDFSNRRSNIFCSAPRVLCVESGGRNGIGGGVRMSRFLISARRPGSLGNGYRATRRSVGRDDRIQMLCVPGDAGQQQRVDPQLGERSAPFCIVIAIEQQRFVGGNR